MLARRNKAPIVRVIEEASLGSWESQFFPRAQKAAAAKSFMITKQCHHYHGIILNLLCNSATSLLHFTHSRNFSIRFLKLFCNSLDYFPPAWHLLPSDSSFMNETLGIVLPIRRFRENSRTIDNLSLNNLLDVIPL